MRTLTRDKFVKGQLEQDEPNLISTRQPCSELHATINATLDSFGPGSRPLEEANFGDDFRFSTVSPQNGRPN